MRISVDFNTMMKDEQERVLINTRTHPALSHALVNGMRVTLCDEDLEVEATLEYDLARRRWLGRPDWSTQRDVRSSSAPPATSSSTSTST